MTSVGTLRTMTFHVQASEATVVSCQADDVTLGIRAPCFSFWSSQTNVLHVSACGATMLRAPVSGALKDDVITECEY